jgi:hypothetical protein
VSRCALRPRLVEWHALLRQTPEVARQLLRKLRPEPIVVEPTGTGIHFRGRAAWSAVLSGGSSMWAWRYPRRGSPDSRSKKSRSGSRPDTQ